MKGFSVSRFDVVAILPGSTACLAVHWQDLSEWSLGAHSVVWQILVPTLSILTIVWSLFLAAVNRRGFTTLQSRGLATTSLWMNVRLAVIAVWCGYVAVMAVVSTEYSESSVSLALLLPSVSAAVVGWFFGALNIGIVLYKSFWVALFTPRRAAYDPYFPDSPLSPIFSIGWLSLSDEKEMEHRLALMTTLARRREDERDRRRALERAQAHAAHMQTIRELDKEVVEADPDTAIDPQVKEIIDTAQARARRKEQLNKLIKDAEANNEIPREYLEELVAFRERFDDMDQVEADALIEHFEKQHRSRGF